MAIGRVVRAIAGFFYVESIENSLESIECSVRGKLKLNSETISVGDKVTYIIENGKGVITGVVERESLLKRPYIANVNLMILVFAHKNPDPNEILVTKFLMLAEQSRIPYILVFNKKDIVTEKEANLLTETYRKYGYKVFSTSRVMNQGREELLAAMDGQITVFAGPSGVGKSALLNMIVPGVTLQTGEISRKIGRGKHTTREVQLIKVNERSYVADTPGFTQISFDNLDPIEYKSLFPDLFKYESECRFSGCFHQSEPDCAVKRAVSEGLIDEKRYQTYLNILMEIKDSWKKRYR